MARENFAKIEKRYTTTVLYDTEDSDESDDSDGNYKYSNDGGARGRWTKKDKDDGTTAVSALRFWLRKSTTPSLRSICKPVVHRLVAEEQCSVCCVCWPAWDQQGKPRLHAGGQKLEVSEASASFVPWWYQK